MHYHLLKRQGIKINYGEYVCQTCNGTGKTKVHKSTNTPLKKRTTYRKCVTCQGTKKVDRKTFLKQLNIET